MDMFHLDRNFRGANDMRRNDTALMPQWVKEQSEED
jgi:hypothetical protein